MSLYAMFGTDKNAESEGVGLDYGDGGRIKIARSGGSNSGYKQALSNLLKEHRHQINTGTLSDEVAERKQREIFARHVVMDFDTVEGPDGEELPYTPDNATKLLADLPDLYADLREQAAKLSNFRAEAIEADAGN